MRIMQLSTIVEQEMRGDESGERGCADLRDDKQYFADHPGASSISSSQVQDCGLHWTPYFLEKRNPVHESWHVSILVVVVQGEELKKSIGASAYIECSSKTQQVMGAKGWAQPNPAYCPLGKQLTRGAGGWDGFCRT